MKLPRKNVRLAFGFLVISLAAGGAYLITTSLYAVRASYPQRPVIAAAIPFLERGSDPAVVLPPHTVEVESGKVWLTITDREGAILASSAVDGGMPVSLASCNEDGAIATNCFFVPKGSVPHRLTLELSGGSRQAVVVEPWQSKTASGYIFAGRTRERIDEQARVTTCLIVATWLAGLGAFLIVNRLRKERGQ